MEWRSFACVAVVLAPLAFTPSAASDDPIERFLPLLGNDCLGALTEARAQSYLETDVNHLPGFPDESGFAYGKGYIEAAFLHVMDLIRDSDGEVVEVIYQVTGYTPQVSCSGLHSICDPKPTEAQILRWVEVAFEGLQAGDAAGISPPVDCDAFWDLVGEPPF